MDVPIRIDVPSYVTGGKRNLKKNFGLSKEQIDKYIKRSLNRSCRIIQAYARKNHRYKDNPARQSRDGVLGLTRAIRFHLLDKAKRAELYIDSDRAPTDGKYTDTYGTYQIGGTKGSKPIHAKRLKFFIDRDRAYQNKNRKGKEKDWDTFMGHEGVWVTTDKVKGIPKDDILGKAVRTNRYRIRDIFNEELRRIINHG